MNVSYFSAVCFICIGPERNTRGFTFHCENHSDYVNNCTPQPQLFRNSQTYAVRSEEERTRAYGLVSATFAASLIISPAVGASLAQTFSTNFVVLVATAVALLDLLFISLIPESLPSHPHTSSSSSASASSASASARHCETGINYHYDYIYIGLLVPVALVPHHTRLSNVGLCKCLFPNE